MCKKHFTQQRSTLQVVCSLTCSITHANNKTKENQRFKVKTREEQKRLQSEAKLQQKIQLTRTVVHHYIHLRDRGKKCITCPSILNHNFDAGHYWHASKSNALRFNLDNIHGQCIQCNRRKYGKFEEYTLRLPERIGEERFQQLQQEYKASVKTVHKWDDESLKIIRKEVRILSRELE